MKIRNGFVSNSSSSSFIVSKSVLNEVQIHKIKNHIEVSRKNIPYYSFGYVEDRDAWSIFETEDYIEGFTGMDNFDMKMFLEDLLNIPPKHITWVW